MASKPVCVNDFEVYAKKHLSKTIYEYFKSGSNDEVTVENNTKSFKRSVGVIE